MAKYRNRLPQMTDRRFLTDAGLETTLIFHEGVDLPHFAAFDQLKNEEGERRVMDYYRRHAGTALGHRVGFILESVGWRASPDWAEKLGYSLEELDRFNTRSIEIMAQLREELETPTTPMVLAGCVGPRGDGYNPADFMSAEESEAYHGRQIRVYADAGADFISALTMTYVEEALGIVKASRSADIPASISFTVETDGRLPSGQPLFNAIREIDAVTDSFPSYYMINCAHPDHFESILDEDAGVVKRIRGIRANASRLSHAELDEAVDLDDGNPAEFGTDYRRLASKLPELRILGGCCGTDHRHIAAAAANCL